MRIAICFYGLVGVKTKNIARDPLDPQVCYNYYKKTFFLMITN